MSRSARADRGGWGRWLLRIALALVVLVAAGVVAFLVATRNPAPSAFYESPDPIPTTPGAIIRSEPFDRGLPPNSRGWRVLYASTDDAGRPIAVSGLVIAPTAPSETPRPVLAWAHGTTGIARPCAPSLSEEPLAGIPDMSAVIAEGWVITLTDYPGLGTVGPHPYLVLSSAAPAVLDSVRAVHQLDTGAALDERFAIWGHSQGGHAALAAGQLAPSYVPELDLIGVAALAPPTMLGENLTAMRGTRPGDVIVIFATEAWTAFYDDLPELLTDRARGPADRMVRQCINQPSRFRLLLDGILLPDEVVVTDPVNDPRWAARLAENSPDPAGVRAPLFVAQGLDDTIIAPAVTTSWVHERCIAGEPTTWRTYPGIGHEAIVDDAGDDALTWSMQLLAGEPVEGCPPAQPPP